jgi:TrmH family RNA methyltransferase
VTTHPQSHWGFADPLTSPRSARVSSVRSLHDRRHRVQRGAFVVEGPQAVRMAALRGALRELYVTQEAADAHPDLVQAARDGDARAALVTEQVAGAMAQTDNPQGVIAVCSLVARPWTEYPLATGRSGAGVLVVLDRISDPGNAGTIIRTADAAGAGAVVFTSGSVDPHNGKCVRATAGSIFDIPIFTDVSAEHVIHAARAAGVRIVAADGRGDIALGTPEARASLEGDIAWVFGNEAHGVDPAIAAEVDARVSIPILGGAESLNVAVAVAVCLYAPIISMPAR